ncbi:hypothetical protein GS575_09565 [Rhodococcus hoagii]|nr:hypothetical protein [Prescottella equi]
MVTAFPCRIPIEHEAYEGAGEDELGNEVEGWADPVEVRVFGWEPPKSDEPVLAGHDRVVVDVVLHAKQSLRTHPKDRLILAGVRHEVVGYPADPNNNPWWQPGMVTIYLRRVEG